MRLLIKDSPEEAPKIIVTESKCGYWRRSLPLLVLRLGVNWSLSLGSFDTYNNFDERQIFNCSCYQSSEASEGAPSSLENFKRMIDKVAKSPLLALMVYTE